MRFLRIAAGLAIAVGMATAASGTVVAQPAHHGPVQGPVRPVEDRVNDPFYDPPAGYQNAAPGTILRVRPVTVKALQLIAVHASAWQLLYRTTDAHGRPYASVTTVLVPSGDARPRALLSYQMAYDSMQRSCMPSYGATQGSPLDILDPTDQAPWGIAPDEIIAALIGVNQGWAVSVPDPGGIDNRFLTPNVMGYVTLDGIRAAEHFAPLGLSGAATRVGMMGYSGGGIATSWAAELQPRYAPELNIAGASVGAPVADLGTALHSADGRLLAGLLPIGVAAVSQDDPVVAARLQSYLTPEGKRIVAAAEQQCLDRNVLATPFLRTEDLLTAPLSQVLADPVIAAAIAERDRPHYVPRTPIYLFNGVHDEVSAIGGTDRMYQFYCAHGASVQYTRDALPDIVSDHSIVAMTGMGGAFAWISGVLDGTAPARPGCSERTVGSTMLDPGWLSSLPAATVTVVKILFGLPIG
jgi:hypothetical protein